MSTGPSGGSGGTTGPGHLARVLARVGSTNGSYQYRAAQDETDHERGRRERFWRSLGKKVRAGSRIRP